MAKVYITHEIQLDYSMAEQFGELVPVTALDVVNLQNSLHNTKLQMEIEDRLKNFTEDDYLLVSGSPYVTVLCTAYIFRKLRLDRIKILRWSNQDKCYHPIAFVI